MRMLPRRRKPHATPEANAALERANEAFERARDQAPIHHALIKSLREVQARNHLAEAFEHALRGKL